MEPASKLPTPTDEQLLDLLGTSSQHAAIHVSDLTTLTDQELLARIARDPNDPALPVLVVRHHDRIARYVRRQCRRWGFTPEQILDAQQEIMVRLLNTRRKKQWDRPIPDFEAFLLTVVRRDCIDYLRYLSRWFRRQPRGADPEKALDAKVQRHRGSLHADDEDDPLLPLLQAEEKELLARAAEQLPDELRQVYTWLMNEVPRKQIAAELGVTLSSVDRRVEKIRTFLTQKLCPREP